MEKSNFNPTTWFVSVSVTLEKKSKRITLKTANQRLWPKSPPKKSVEDAIAQIKTQKAADAWLISARWWTESKG